LVDTIKELEKYKIPFHIRRGDAISSIKKYISKANTGYLITDFFPLRVYKNRVAKLVSEINIPFEIVDAHNIIPTWTVSEKQEFAAHTLRRKIHLLLDEFMHPIPKIIPHPFLDKKNQYEQFKPECNPKKH
jgi:Deoxyribodipyrimidine photolyase